MRERERRDAKTIFVSRLAPSVNARDVADLFESVGEVRDVRLVSDRHASGHKGAGYVEFYEERAVRRAIRMGGEVFFGIKIEVRAVGGGDVVEVGWSRRRPLQYEARGDERKVKVETPVVELVSVEELKRLLNPNNLPVPGVKAEETDDGFRKLYFGSVSFHLTEADIRQLFDPFGEIVSLCLQRETDGRSKGYGFVEFVSHEAAHKALQINGLVLTGRPMKVALATSEGRSAGVSGAPPKAMERVPLPLADVPGELDEGRDGGLAMNVGQRQMLMQQLSRGESIGAKLKGDVEKLKTVDKATRSLILANMFDPNVEEAGFERELAEDVRDECNSEYGKVTHLMVEVKSHGIVYVRFERVEAAEKACRELNGRWFGGKKITVGYVNDDEYRDKFPKGGFE